MGLSSVKNVDFIQCNLKSDSIFSYYWLFFGLKTYTVYAVTQPERELLSNRYGSLTMLPTLYTSQLSLAVLVCWPIRALYSTAPVHYSQYKISHVHDVWRDFNSRGQWTIGEAKLKCVLTIVSIPCWYFIPRFTLLITVTSHGIYKS